MEDDHFDYTTKLAKKTHWSLLVTPRKLMDKVTIWVIKCTFILQLLLLHIWNGSWSSVTDLLLGSPKDHYTLERVSRVFMEVLITKRSLHSWEGIKSVHGSFDHYTPLERGVYEESVHWKFDHFCEYGLEGFELFTILLAALEGSTISLIQLSFSWIYYTQCETPGKC